MQDNNDHPRCTIVQFPTEERRRAAAKPAVAPADACDQGPSPEESLRIMRAFVGIRNRKLRADLIATVEGASRRRGQTPSAGND